MKPAIDIQLPTAYTAAGIMAMASLFDDVPGLSPAQKETAVCAILRVGKGIYTEAATPANGGLDLMYSELQEGSEEFQMTMSNFQRVINETLRDLLNVVCLKSF